jgi:hypothetical protein
MERGRPREAGRERKREMKVEDVPFPNTPTTPSPPCPALKRKIGGKY